MKIQGVFGGFQPRIAWERESGKGNVRGDLDGRAKSKQALLEKTRRSATVRAVTKVEVATTTCWLDWAVAGVLGMNGFHQRDIFNADILLLWVKWQQVEEIALCPKCPQRW